MTAINNTNTTTGINRYMAPDLLQWYFDRVYEMEKEVFHDELTSDGLQFIKFRLDEWGHDKRLNSDAQSHFNHMSTFIKCIDEEFEEYAITETDRKQLDIELTTMLSWLAFTKNYPHDIFPI